MCKAELPNRPFRQQPCEWGWEMEGSQNVGQLGLGWEVKLLVSPRLLLLTCALLFVSQDSLILQLGMARVKLNQQQPGCQVVPRPRAQSAAFISTGHPRTKTFLLGVF